MIITVSIALHFIFYRFNPPRRQPDNREATQQGGEEEACMAVLNNFYGDGIKWHDGNFLPFFPFFLILLVLVCKGTVLFFFPFSLLEFSEEKS